MKYQIFNKFIVLAVFMIISLVIFPVSRSNATTIQVDDGSSVGTGTYDTLPPPPTAPTYYTKNISLTVSGVSDTYSPGGTLSFTLSASYDQCSNTTLSISSQADISGGNSTSGITSGSTLAGGQTLSGSGSLTVPTTPGDYYFSVNIFSTLGTTYSIFVNSDTYDNYEMFSGFSTMAEADDYIYGMIASDPAIYGTNAVLRSVAVTPDGPSATYSKTITVTQPSAPATAKIEAEATTLSATNNGTKIKWTSSNVIACDINKKDKDDIEGSLISSGLNSESEGVQTGTLKSTTTYSISCTPE